MASLVLEDGTVFKGKSFGAAKTVAGEVGMFRPQHMLLYIIVMFQCNYLGFKPR